MEEFRIVIDHDQCTGHGRCYVLEPGLFRDDENGYGQVVGDGAFGEESLASAERAVLACPEQAISIEGR